MSVEDQVDTKQEYSKGSNHHLEDSIVEDKSKETQDEECHTSNEDNPPFRSEVSLCSAGVSSAGGCYGDCSNRSTDDWLTVLEIIGAVITILIACNLERLGHADVRDKICLCKCEKEEQDVVDRDLSSEWCNTNHHNFGDNYDDEGRN